jgi:wingless-type MMTV integration site family protein 7
MILPPILQGPRSRRSLMLLVRAKHALRKRNPAHRLSANDHSVVGDGLEKKPRRSELVYLEQSPNYCDSDSSMGSLGTRGRRCLGPGGSRTNGSSVGSGGQESCDILCCGRGYNTHQIYRKWKCKCKFRWCCEVECQNCQERVDVFLCN